MVGARALFLQPERPPAAVVGDRDLRVVGPVDEPVAAARDFAGLAQFAGHVPVEILGYTEFPAVGALPYFLTLGPYGFYWFELRKPG